MAPDDATACLEVRTLGCLEIRVGEQPLETITLRKAQALLIYLLLHPGPHPRGRVAGLLWGGCSERKARHNLRQTLWHLRRRLPPDLLMEDRLTVGVREGARVQVDARTFQAEMEEAAHCQRKGDVTGAVAHLQKAVALYEGDFLTDLILDDAPEFDAWRAGHAATLREQALVAFSRLATHLMRRGDYDQALVYARAQVQLEPWWEEGHRLVMTLLALTGQRSAALAQYDICRRQLEEEVGVAPMPETTALYERLRAWQDADWHAPPPASLRLPLRGRQEERATLASWWERARRGQGRLGLITGEAGIGKTRLAEEMMAYVKAQGARVLQGRCYEFGGDVPYQAIAEALRGLWRQVEFPSDWALSPVWLAELARLLPELRQDHPNLPQPRQVSGEAARQRLFEAVALLLQTLAARHPVLLFLDDLQWADIATLDLLHYLTRRLKSVPVWLLGAYRPEEVGVSHHLTRLRQGLSRDHLVDELELAALAPAAVSDIARWLVGSEAASSLGELLYRESEGNPFFLVETIYMLQEEGALAPTEGSWQEGRSVDTIPHRVQDVILQRVGRLSEPARRLLTLAAVIGRSFDDGLLQAAAQETPTTVTASVEEWLARHLVQPQATAGCYDFSHDKIRAVVYETTVAERRRALHRQVGEALERQGEAQAGLLAYHWVQADLPQKAIPYLLQAGDEARLLYAHEEAVSYYRQALDYLRQGDDEEKTARALMKLGLTYHNAFDFAQARAAYDEAFRHWQHATARPQRAPLPPASNPLRVRWQEPLTLDPAFAPDAHTDCLIAQLFSGLVALSPDMSITPDLARRWEVHDAGRVFIFHLREDARWRDGVPVTAHDFEYAWKRVLDPATGSPAASFLYDLRGGRAFHQGQGKREDVGVRALDDFTLRVELAHPVGYFSQLLTHVTWYPVPRHIVQEKGPAWAQDAHLVSNGAFVVQTWQQGERIELARNPRYHGRFSGNLQRVILRLVQDWDTRRRLYEEDELEILGVTYMPAGMREEVRQRHGSEYITRPSLETHFLAFDVTRPPFDDARVRRAFVLATNRSALADEVLQGYGTPATGGLTPPGMPGHASGIALPFQPEAARRLLAQAGYPQGRGLPPLHVLVYEAVAPRNRFLQAQWRQILGVTLRLEIVDWPAYLARLGRGRYHIINLGWVADYPDPDSFLRVSRARAWPAWRHAGYDDLVRQARVLTGAGQRMACYRQAEEILVQEAPILPLIYKRDHLLLKPRVRRYPMSAMGQTFWQDVVVSQSVEAF